MPFLLSGPDIPLPVYLDARLQAGILAIPLPGNALSHHILQEPDDGDGNSTVRQQIPAKMSPFAISATHPLDFTNSITVTLDAPDNPCFVSASIRIPDGTEIGIKRPMERSEFTAGLLYISSLEGATDPSVFVPDSDPSTKTSPTNVDFDGDGLPDGLEKDVIRPIMDITTTSGTIHHGHQQDIIVQDTGPRRPDWQLHSRCRGAHLSNTNDKIFILRTSFHQMVKI